MDSNVAALTLRLSVVILNYRTPALVLDCLASLAEQIDPAFDRVVVVDNASGDGSAGRIQAAIAERGYSLWCELLESSVNGGFAAGNNLGIQFRAARYYLLLNSDTVVRQGALPTLLSAMAADARIGLMGPRLEWPDATPQVSGFRAPSPWSEVIAAAESGPVTRLLARFNIPVPISDQSQAVDWISFACVLIRREVFEQIGLLDEGFFMYFEDTDFCLRAGQMGWQTVLFPGARVVHLRGGSGEVKERLAKRKRPPSYLYWSRTRYFRKHFGFAGPLMANIAWAFGDVLARLRHLVDSRRPPACDMQWRDNWSNVMNPLKPFRVPPA